MTRHDRRRFLQQGLVAAATAGWIGRRGSATAPSETVNLAVMGVHGRGGHLAQGFARLPNVTIAAICDVDAAATTRCIGSVREITGHAPRAEGDFRRLLDDPTIDGLVVATPDHWHAIPTILACQAGKHVYVEKPASHNILEGERMVAAAHKYRRVVQVGTQRRSSPAVQEMVEFLQSGGIGDIPFTRAWITSQRPNIGYAQDGPVPEGVDYDLWLGPAPARAFNRNHFHYHWHWFWEYGTGELGNNGIHGLDVARWGIGVEEPSSVVSMGGKYTFDDDQVSPDTQTVLFEYPGRTLVWEHRTWSPHRPEGSSFGCAFYGTKGTVFYDGSGWRVEVDRKVENRSKSSSADTEVAHLANWIAGIRTGAPLNAEIETGHRSTVLCHIGNISQHLGRRLGWDAEQRHFVPADSDADHLLGREYRSPWTLPTV